MMFKSSKKMYELVSALTLMVFMGGTSFAADFFEDVTAGAGLPQQGKNSLAFGDFNGDGLVDLLMPGGLFQNVSSRGRIAFRDVTEEKGLKNLASGLKLPIFVDLNNDGRLDIVSTGGQLFLQNEKGVFVDSAREFGFSVPDDVSVISAVDVDRDGYVDLVMGRQEVPNSGVFLPPLIFKNLKGRAFSDISSLMNFAAFPAYTRGIAWADFNNDRTPDAFFANYRLRPSFLFQNSNGVLQEVAAVHGVQGELDPQRFWDPVMSQKFGPQYGHATGAVWTDLNNDGLLDLWISKLVHKYVGPTSDGGYDIRGYVCDDSKIYRNMGAPDYRFVNMRGKSGLPVKPIGGSGVYKGDELWFHSTAADFDNDGLVDVQVTQVYDLDYARSLLFRNKGNFQFEEVALDSKIRVSDSYASGWADLDNDGKMDLLISGRAAPGENPQIRVFRNVIQNGNGYLKIKLIGTRSGRSPVTAQVRLFHSQGLFMRQYEGTTGANSQQNDPTLHFGLGAVRKIDRMEIRWPSGQTQTLRAVPINQTITVKEP